MGKYERTRPAAWSNAALPDFHLRCTVNSMTTSVFAEAFATTVTLVVRYNQLLWFHGCSYIGEVENMLICKTAYLSLYGRPM